jgi:mRNA-degrading endonuclease RelE of RelBE toxin-antitoxin system
LCYDQIVRRVVLSDIAVRLFRALPKRQQAGVKDGIRVHLQENDPTEETPNKFRLRRPSAHADYELRLDDVRVFYRVRDELVEVVLIGKKRGDRLLIGGEEFEI